ncbi:MAG: hypothetical protein KF696_11435 [Planctomycetes bacterium]|nr:hypothetical protein [Planctomycetota bacterium]MCW8135736.1 hypothetical protein [Planctomycetota bacterium]
MARVPRTLADDQPTDPFGGVDAKSITEIEMDERVTLAREPLPAAAKLTDLPLKWVLLALVLCVGVSELAQRVERKHLIEKARDTKLITDEEAQTARDADRIVDDRERIQERIRELKKRQQDLKTKARDASERKDAPDKPAPGSPDDKSTDEPTIPLTLEALRAEIRRLAGDNFDNYRRWATLVALLVGAFGLILMAVFVRVLAAVVVGGIGVAVAFLAGGEWWALASAGGAGAIIGAVFAPRLLLANMLVNVTLAGTVIGGVVLGGGVYLATTSELYAIFGLGAGVVLGAIVGFKYSRQLFLLAVLVNCAGAATQVLWLAWGDLLPHFWPVTFGGLMILDAIATRIYHKVRWGRV